MALLYSLIESPTHPDFSALYRQLGLQELRFTTARKAISSLRRAAPDLLVAEFFYGYGNNYAGVNVSNLDVLLSSLRKFAPAARTIVLAAPADARHVDKLTALFPIAATLRQPVTAAVMQERLSGLLAAAGEA